MNNPCEYDIRVQDSEFELTGELMYKYGELLGNCISQYILCLSNIGINAIPSGKVHDALVCYIAHLSPIEGIAEESGKEFKRLTKGYIDRIDKKDRYLYETGGAVVRDFTEKEYRCLQKMLKDDIWDIWDLMFQDNITDWFKEKIYWKAAYILTGVKWDDMSNPGVDIKKCHRRLLDHNNADATTIRDIFIGVRECDKEYGRNFYEIFKTFEEIRKYLIKATSIIEPGKGKFTVENIVTTLGPLLEEIKKQYNESVAIYDRNEDLSIGQIEDFVSQPWASLYFQGVTNIFSNFLADIGFADVAVSTIFTHYEIDKIILKDYIKNNEYDKDAYEKYMVKSELMDMLDDMAKTYKYSESEEKAILDDCKTFVKYIKKYGDNWYEFMNTTRDKSGKLLLDGRTKTAKEFKQYLGKLGGVTTILKIGDNAIDLLAKCFTDYSLNNKILNSLIENSSSNPTMESCAREIRTIYENKLYLIIDDCMNKAIDTGIDKALKQLGKECSPIKIVSQIEDGIKITGNISGLGKQSKSLMNAIAYTHIYTSSEEAYLNALEKVKNADKNADNYTILVQQLKDCFNMTRNSAIKAFKAMAGYYDGTKKAYYEYCASVAEDATMHVDKNNPGSLKFMSYEQWLAA